MAEKIFYGACDGTEAVNLSTLRAQDALLANNDGTKQKALWALSVSAHHALRHLQPVEHDLDTVAMFVGAIGKFTTPLHRFKPELPLYLSWSVNASRYLARSPRRFSGSA